jgi:HD superfamily phosphohydrolase
MAKKRRHEIRDPIHVFIRLDTDERKVLDSRPFQRLRQIHQLALTYLVYPGATHRRFEHSLGVMELASRIYDVVTRREHIHFDSIRGILPEYDDLEHKYWRRVLRMAALCHDLGHLPFSHGAEKQLLPEGWSHERITGEIIRSDEMREIWNKMKPPLDALDIEKIALDPKEIKTGFSDWEAILAEIIVGDTFGADRIDYLLRDSLHAGVAYGKFDHYRLIDTLRILPKSNDSAEPTLGLDLGGIQSAEALLWARYFMFSQVYCHPIRRIYDIHLADFLEHRLDGGKFPTDVEGLLALTDSEVIVWLRETVLDKASPIYSYAERIIMRKHFKLLYERNPPDLEINPDTPEKAVYAAASEKFDADLVRCDSYPQKGGGKIFPVRAKDNTILQSVSLSDTLDKVPIVTTGFVFIDSSLLEEARKWLKDKRLEILEPQMEIEE